MTRLRLKTAGDVCSLLASGVVDSSEWRRIIDEWKMRKRVDVEDMTLDDYSTLSGMSSDWQLSTFVAEKLGVRLTTSTSAKEYISFLAGVTDGIKRIQDAFEKIPSPSLSAEEQQAGFGKLAFGLFGVVDKLARRQGVRDEDIKMLPVSSIIGKLMIDGRTAVCERRYNEIIRRR